MLVKLKSIRKLLEEQEYEEVIYSEHGNVLEMSYAEDTIVSSMLDYFGGYVELEKMCDGYYIDNYQWHILPEWIEDNEYHILKPLDDLIAEL